MESIAANELLIAKSCSTGPTRGHPGRAVVPVGGLGLKGMSIGALLF